MLLRALIGQGARRVKSLGKTQENGVKKQEIRIKMETIKTKVNCYAGETREAQNGSNHIM